MTASAARRAVRKELFVVVDLAEELDLLGVRVLPGVSVRPHR